MALATRCPHCQTAFKVANDQLKLHAGLVRCGSCQQTFNAVENLIPTDGQKTSATPTVSGKAAKTSTPAVSSAPSKPFTPAANTAAALTPTDKKSVAAEPVAPAAVQSSTSVSAPSSTPLAKPIAATPEPAVEASTAPKIDVAAKKDEQAVVPQVPAKSAMPAAGTAPLASPETAKAQASKPGEEVLAAISKAEKEFEAENLDKTKITPPPPLQTGSATSPVAATTGTRAGNTANANAAPVKPIAATAATPPATPEISSSALDFDLGDGSFSTSTEEVSDNDVTRAELETRAALMDPPTADWSMNEGAENAPATTDTAAPVTATKVWRHKENTGSMEVDSTSQTEAATDLPEDETSRKPYIGAEEAALANQAAISEDSSSDADEDEHRPNFVIQAEKQQRRKRVATIMLTLMVLLLFPLLLAQSAYIFRSPLAAWLPESKPYLQQACKLLQCQVNLPAQIEQITVESNELQALAPDRNVFLLVMQIQNHSSIVQAWPTVELVLNDAKDKAVLQRVFGPDEYLSEKDKLAKGFTAGSDQNIKLYFELPKLKAAGYHVSVFYP